MMTIERDYGTGPTSVDYFIGNEVENSPAKGMKTLFVVGIQPAETTRQYAAVHNIRHIYLGANMSLHGVANDDHDTWRRWDQMIEELLSDSSIDYITVDFNVTQVEGFLESTISEKNRVIPMISVKLPYTKLLNYNTIVKIDDNGFNQTNPGVWCHSLHDLLDKNTFTPWSDYKSDVPIN